MKPRRLCVVTGSRADYGLLYWLLRELQDEPSVELQLIATGTHLAPEFGETWHAIVQDGFEIAAKIEILLSNDTPVGIAKSMGLATIKFAETFEQLRPDILVVLGDRFEILAAAQAAMVARIPIAHIHGGERSEGVIDEAIRHSLTKMSHLHFTSAQAYSRRVIQLGEQPERVYTVGAPGLENIRCLTPLDRDALQERLGIPLNQPLFAVAHHPLTLSDQDPTIPITALLAALDAIPEATIVLTGSNADTHGRLIGQIIEKWAGARRDRAVAVTSLGRVGWLSLLKEADCVIGNSSSGILEAPASGTPAVNIGDRQRGRLRSPSVIDCAETTDEIIVAIRRALSAEFQEIAARRESPFGDGQVAQRIREILVSTPLDTLLTKEFFDLAEQEGLAK
jgi:UDP-N-acetylglucosamine 2-epimerase (non-hydrolysing)/GDP/UDP-N,N'-diacetylbacillosamine 2-epimerase (hydrolysing)